MCDPITKVINQNCESGLPSLIFFDIVTRVNEVNEVGEQTNYQSKDDGVHFRNNGPLQISSRVTEHIDSSTLVYFTERQNDV